MIQLHLTQPQLPQDILLSRHFFQLSFFLSRHFQHDWVADVFRSSWRSTTGSRSQLGGVEVDNKSHQKNTCFRSWGQGNHNFHHHLIVGSTSESMNYHAYLGMANKHVPALSVFFFPASKIRNKSPAAVSGGVLCNKAVSSRGPPPAIFWQVCLHILWMSSIGCIKMRCDASIASRTGCESEAAGVTGSQSKGLMLL